jgi:hypothetical protein
MGKGSSAAVSRASLTLNEADDPVNHSEQLSPREKLLLYSFDVSAPHRWEMSIDCYERLYQLMTNRSSVPDAHSLRSSEILSGIQTFLDCTVERGEVEHTVRQPGRSVGYALAASGLVARKKLINCGFDRALLKIQGVQTSSNPQGFPCEIALLLILDAGGQYERIRSLAIRLALPSTSIIQAANSLITQGLVKRFCSNDSRSEDHYRLSASGRSKRAALLQKP